MTKVIQNFAIKYFEDFTTVVDEQLAFFAEWIYDADQLLTLGLKNLNNEFYSKSEEALKELERTR